MGTSGVDVVVSNDDESKVLDGEQSGPRSGAEGQWLISLANRCDGELVRACGVVGSVTRLRVWIEEEVMRQGWRRVASDGAVRRYESRVETGGAAWRRRRRRWSLRIVMPEQYYGQWAKCRLIACWLLLSWVGELSCEAELD